jgi:hypothetical protein
MTQPQSRDAVSRRTALAGLGAGTLGLALAAGARPAAAQDATAEALAGHPLVGTWAVMVPGAVVPVIFGSDGSVVAAFPPNYVDPALGLAFQGPALGRWEATGERSGHFTVLQARSDAGGAYVGTFQYEANPEVNADGRTLVNTQPQRVIVRDAANTVVSDEVVQLPPVTATRVGATMDSVVLPVASPTPATPTS